jgi:hypothetical protein
MPTEQEPLPQPLHFPDSPEGGWALHDGTHAAVMFFGKDTEEEARTALPKHEKLLNCKLTVVRWFSE